MPHLAHVILIPCHEARITIRHADFAVDDSSRISTKTVFTSRKLTSASCVLWFWRDIRICSDMEHRAAKNDDVQEKQVVPHLRFLGIR